MVSPVLEAAGAALTCAAATSGTGVTTPWTTTGAPQEPQNPFPSLKATPHFAQYAMVMLLPPIGGTLLATSNLVTRPGPSANSLRLLCVIGHSKCPHSVEHQARALSACHISSGKLLVLLYRPEHHRVLAGQKWRLWRNGVIAGGDFFDICRHAIFNKR